MGIFLGVELRTHWPLFAIRSPLCVPVPQNLVEAAEEADLNHKFNESLVVSPPAPELLLSGCGG